MRIRFPSASMVVALLALALALGGTAGATLSIVPLARRALTADRAKEAAVADSAKKLGPQSVAAIVQQASASAAQQPGPSSTAAGLITYKSAPYSLNPQQQSDFTVKCDSGQKAIGGGIDESSGTAVPFDTRPSIDGASWQMYLADFSDTEAASGTLLAVCLK